MSRWIAVTMFAVCAISIAATALCDDNLLVNGDLSQGSKDTPLVWRADTLIATAGSLQWIHPADAPGELRISNDGSNIAQWSQPVDLDRGWYLLTAEMRSDAKPANGVVLGIRIGGRTFGVSPGEGRAWSHVGAYFKLGDREEYDAKPEIVCQLSAKGAVSWRQIRLIKVAQEPASGRYAQIDVAQALAARSERKSIARPKRYALAAGAPWTVPFVMLLFAAIAVAGWVRLGRD
ncbi:MAG TPA: hypothetical protein VEF03_05020 [Candidatus Binataceae bacterium]|nr:hypothetical protein [Candidatus Binataceae bacterium]